MLRLTSGILRGLNLQAPPEKLAQAGVRPTGQKTRQAVFNVLRNYQWQGAPILEGARVADLFAGAGTLGFEALSMGASDCSFIERDPTVLRILNHNTQVVSEKLSKQQVTANMSVIAGDVFAVYERLPLVRVLFVDAPYAASCGEKLLEHEVKKSKLEQGGLLVLECSSREIVPEQMGQLVRFDLKNYGDTAVHYFVKKGPEL